jgi:hypothetical protein
MLKQFYNSPFQNGHPTLFVCCQNYVSQGLPAWLALPASLSALFFRPIALFRFVSHHLSSGNFSWAQHSR